VSAPWALSKSCVPFPFSQKQTTTDFTDPTDKKALLIFFIRVIRVIRG